VGWRLRTLATLDERLLQISQPRLDKKLNPSKESTTMHDPFQTYANQPYANMGIPYNIQQTSGINPLTGINPLAAAALGLSPGIPTTTNPMTAVPQTGQQGYGFYPAQNFINPQQLQLAAAFASQAGLHNPIVAALLTNPLVAAGLHSQFGQQQQFGQQPHSLYSQFGQNGGLPFGQGNPLAGAGYPLAPQSWVGQGQLGGGQGYGQSYGQGYGQGYGQIHPLVAQLTARALQGQSFSPWGY
jgi:hypothetical protein